MPLAESYIDAIKGFEGFAPRAKWDFKQYSGGYGTRARPGQTFTQEQADAALRAELANANKYVTEFGADLPPGWEPALTSLTFNAGPEWTQSGLGSAVRAGDWDKARGHFAEYSRAGGRINRALVDRRAAELGWIVDPLDVPQQVAGADASSLPPPMVLGGPRPPPDSGNASAEGLMTMAGGILSRPSDRQKASSGILGDGPARAFNAEDQLVQLLGQVNSPSQTFGQALVQMGAGIAANADRGWGPGIGAGLSGASDAIGQSQNSRTKLLGLIAEQQAAAARAAADGPYKQAKIDNMRSLMQQRKLNADLMRSLMPGAGDPNAASQVSPIQPQSYAPGAADPLLQQVADATQAAPPATTGAAPPDMIQTPYGPMTRQDALKRGGQMMLLPQFATAGKALVDLAQQGKDPSLGVPTTNQLEERTLNSATHLARLGDIEKQFDSRFLEIPTRLQMLGASWSAKLGSQIGGKLSPEITKDLTAYAKFRSGSVNNLNTILKELSGAAVTPQEYERIQNDQPVAGTGIFDGDDPVTFKAKLERSSAALKAAIARFNFMRSKGLRFDKDRLDQFMALDDVPAAIDARGAAIERQLKRANPNANPMQLQQGVRQQLKQEFGI